MTIEFYSKRAAYSQISYQNFNHTNSTCKTNFFRIANTTLTALHVSQNLTEGFPVPEILGQVEGFLEAMDDDRSEVLLSSAPLYSEEFEYLDTYAVHAA